MCFFALKLIWGKKCPSFYSGNNSFTSGKHSSQLPIFPEVYVLAKTLPHSAQWSHSKELHLRGLKLLKGTLKQSLGLQPMNKLQDFWTCVLCRDVCQLAKNYTQHISTNGGKRDDDFDLFCSHGAWPPIWSQMWGQSPDLNWIETLRWGFKKAVKANSHKPQLTEAALWRRVG